MNFKIPVLLINKLKFMKLGTVNMICAISPYSIIIFAIAVVLLSQKRTRCGQNWLVSEAKILPIFGGN
eukprot:UN28229